MDDFDLRDLLSPPLRFQSDLAAKPAPHNTVTKKVDTMVLAMGYVPSQCWQDLYEPTEALSRGTIFRQLDLPFEGGRG